MGKTQRADKRKATPAATESLDKRFEGLRQRWERARQSGPQDKEPELCHSPTTSPSSQEPRALIHDSRSFIVPLDLWERFSLAIEDVRHITDPALPCEVQEALTESAEGTRDNIRTEVPVSGEPDPWRHLPPEEDRHVSIINAAAELDLLLSLLQKDYGGLTDPNRRPEAYPELKPLTRQPIDNLVRSTVDLKHCFVELGWVPEEMSAVVTKLEWSDLISYKELRTVLKISHNTLKSRLVEGEEPADNKIRFKSAKNARKIQVVVSDLSTNLQARFRRSGKHHDS